MRIQMMKKLLNSLFLFINAILRSVILLPISVIYTAMKIILRIFMKPHWALRKLIWYTANTIWWIAKWIDQIWNVVCRDLFNDVLITEYWYRFGDVRETISSVLWKNQKRKTLTKTWKLLVKILDTIEENHCEKSIVYFTISL